MLVLLMESDRGSAEVPLRGGQTVIGRDPGCNFAVDDDLMSRRHARFRIENDLFVVEDLGSTNGVYVNGTRITGKAVLRPGDLVLVGASKLRVDERADSAASPAGAVPSARVPSRERATASVTARPPPPGQEADQTGVARRGQVLDLLAGLAAKALAQGRPEQAEQILSPPLHQILGEARNRRSLRAEDAERACSHALRLAEATGKGEWIDFVIELHAIEPRPLPGPGIDGLLDVVRKVSKIDLKLLRTYLDSLRAKADTLSAGDRFLLQRLETFERVASAR